MTDVVIFALASTVCFVQLIASTTTVPGLYEVKKVMDADPD